MHYSMGRVFAWAHVVHISSALGHPGNKGSGPLIPNLAVGVLQHSQLAAGHDNVGLHRHVVVCVANVVVQLRLRKKMIIH